VRKLWTYLTGSKRRVKLFPEKKTFIILLGYPRELGGRLKVRKFTISC